MRTPAGVSSKRYQAHPRERPIPADVMREVERMYEAPARSLWPVRVTWIVAGAAIGAGLAAILMR
jgi:hypothetical protein